MATELVTLQLPANLYEKLQTLATEEHTDLAGVITKLVTKAYQQRSWLHDLVALRQQIQNEGELSLGNTKEEVVARLRQTRQEIFETEYAHLYR
ncbi:MAG: hypothetical protein ACRDEA_17735 [Microcystaceae cyanobacterium]